MKTTKETLELIIRGIVKEILSNVSSKSINEDFHQFHKDYRLYEGDNRIVAVFEDNSKMAFNVHFRENRGENREKWRKRAASRWKSIANEIHRNIELTEVGNPVQKSWKQSFKEALEDPRLAEFIRTEKHKNVFGKDIAPVQSPVNFT